MANGVNPLDHPTRQDDAEIHLVISFSQDCPVDRPFPFETILWVHSFEPPFPIRRSFSRIETVNAVPLLGEVQHASVRNAPDPAARASQLLCFSQVGFAEPQAFLCALPISNAPCRTDHLPRTAPPLSLHIPLQFTAPDSPPRT